MTTNIQLAQQVARHVQLKSVALKSAHIDSFMAPGQALESAVSISQQHRCDYKESVTEDEREIQVQTDFKLLASVEETELVKLDASFLLVYSLPKEPELKAVCLRHFAEVNGAYNAWPYWRELVQSSTGRVGLGWLVIPVFRPTSVPAQEDDCDEGEPATRASPRP